MLKTPQICTFDHHKDIVKDVNPTVSIRQISDLGLLSRQHGPLHLTSKLLYQVIFIFRVYL